MERKKEQLDERSFDAKIQQRQNEIYSIENKIKVLSRERDIIVGGAEERTMLSINKRELENKKKQLKKM